MISNGKQILIELGSDKVSYKPGDIVKIKYNIVNTSRKDFENIKLEFYIEDALCNILYKKEKTLDISNFKKQISGIIEWKTPKCMMRGFVARAKACQNQKLISCSSLIFEVVENQSLVPKYGFFATFDINEHVKFKVERLARFHINYIQFYDWFERHGDYTPKKRKYYILNKPVYLNTLLEKISVSKQKGIKCLAYTTIYSVDEKIYLKNRDWALTDKNDKPIRFANWLYIVNPGKECDFHSYLLNELKESISIFDWDGFHLDQYGEKLTRNAYWKNRKFNTATSFVDLINQAKNSLKKDIVFNLVDAWPLETIAKEAAVSFIYVELWSYQTYASVQNVIRKARKLSKKPVVVAAYTDTHVPSVLLLDAEIFANQGLRIEIGEGNGYLTDPYFPNYDKMPKSLEHKLQNYYDVITRYEEFIYSSDVKYLDVPKFISVNRHFSYSPEPNTIQVIPYEKEDTLIIHLINFTNIHEMLWKKHQTEPFEQKDIMLRINMENIEDYKIKAYVVETEKTHEPKALNPVVNKNVVNVKIPKLKYWDIILIKKSE
ncbi:MAG: hypothetical protein J7K82_01315 [Thermoproteales archaeon]|nr:hypothetical protein [Thermoproteales archaeon]